MRLAPVVAFAFALATSPAVAADRVAPYVPTPDGAVRAMLELANVRPGDVVVDLGSGDGRLVIAAARDFGASGFGVDIDPSLVDYANRKAAEQGVADRAKFHERDLFATDLSGATVVTIYLLPTIMDRVAAKLAAELRPGTRVVTHDYVLPGWRAERVRIVDAPEKNDTIGTRAATIYLYAAPSR